MQSPKSAPRLSPDQSVLTFEAIGTQWKIELNALPKKALSTVEKALQDRIAEFDKVYSRFRKDSLVSQMARRAGDFELPADAEPMIKLYDTLYALTGGRMTPAIGDVLEATGYDADYSLTPGEVQPPLLWPDVAGFSPPHLKLRYPVCLDFGAAGKGGGVDMLADLL